MRTQRLAQPRSPTTTGKIERFHKTLRDELLDDQGPFQTVEAAQAAIDRWVAGYNAERPHQSLGMATPAGRFVPDRGQRETVGQLALRVPDDLADPLAVSAVQPVQLGSSESRRQGLSSTPSSSRWIEVESAQTPTVRPARRGPTHSCRPASQRLPDGGTTTAGLASVTGQKIIIRDGKADIIDAVRPAHN